MIVVEGLKKRAEPGSRAPHLMDVSRENSVDDLDHRLVIFFEEREPEPFRHGLNERARESRGLFPSPDLEEVF